MILVILAIGVVAAGIAVLADTRNARLAAGAVAVVAGAVAFIGVLVR